MPSTDAVANYFIDRAAAGGAQLTPMAVQKLVFFAHGWHLAVRGVPLVREPVQVWRWGPVFGSLYREFAEFGSKPITRKARDFEMTENGNVQVIEPQIEDATGWTQRFLDQVWNQYGRYTGVQLSNLTHEPGTPWRQIADQFPAGIPRGCTIPEPLIQQYFTSQMAPVPA